MRVGLEHLQDPADPNTFVALATITGAGRFEPGDLIRIHAGSAPSPLPADGRQHLYVTVAGAASTWMLHEGRDICRLVDSDGQVVGIQEFVAALTTVNVMWVWNADYTRAFIVPSSVALGQVDDPIPQGTYRIEWQFSGDISATVHAAPILRRGGRKEAEQAVTQFTV